MKKVFFIMLCAVGFSLISCGSTKDQVPGEIDSIDETTIAAPEVENQDASNMYVEAEEQAQATEETQSTEEAEAAEEAEAGEEAEADDTAALEPDLSYSDPDFPPLEEIEEPQLIDVPYEEVVRTQLEQKELEEKEKEEAEQAKLIEPVAQEDVTPPTDNEHADALETSVDTELAEGSLEDDEQNLIEPTIEIQEEPEEIIITPSRSVSLKKGETLVITYPGSGWIYMGSTSEYNNLASRGRKLGTTDTKYTLLAKEAGTQIHHFYKVDNLTGEYIDDYIEVTVLEKKGASSTVVNAPDYKEVVPKKAEAPAKSSTTKKKEAEEKAQQQAQQEQQTQTETTVKAETTPAKTTQTKAATTKTTTTAPAAQKEDEIIVIDDEETQVVEVLDEGVEAIPDLDNYMSQAKNLINSKDYAKAYNMLITYLEYANDGRDEALYILGQILESDSPVKNIKEAISTYQTLCDSYPASKYWDSANKRIIYLKRFYIDIH